MITIIICVLFTHIHFYLVVVSILDTNTSLSRLKSREKQRQRSANKGYEQLGKDEATGGEPLATLIKIPAVEFYLRRARYWS